MARVSFFDAFAHYLLIIYGIAPKCILGLNFFHLQNIFQSWICHLCITFWSESLIIARLLRPSMPVLYGLDFRRSFSLKPSFNEPLRFAFSSSNGDIVIF